MALALFKLPLSMDQKRGEMDCVPQIAMIDPILCQQDCRVVPWEIWCINIYIYINIYHRWGTIRKWSVQISTALFSSFFADGALPPCDPRRCSTTPWRACRAERWQWLSSWRSPDPPRSSLQVKGPKHMLKSEHVKNKKKHESTRKCKSRSQQISPGGSTYSAGKNMYSFYSFKVLNIKSAKDIFEPSETSEYQFTSLFSHEYLAMAKHGLVVFYGFLWFSVSHDIPWGSQGSHGLIGVNGPHHQGRALRNGSHLGEPQWMDGNGWDYGITHDGSSRMVDWCEHDWGILMVNVTIYMAYIRILWDYD